MPTIKTDIGESTEAVTEARSIKLPDATATSLVNTRIAERQKRIEANDANRVLLRAANGSKEAADAEAAKTAATLAAEASLATFTATVETAKGAEDGAAVFVAELGALLFDLPPPVADGPVYVERKRIPLKDAEAASAATAYKDGEMAKDLATNLKRQIDDYLAAHPPIDGEPGHLIPEPQALLDLRAALKAQADIAKAAEVALRGIIMPLLAGEKDWAGWKLDLATGDLVVKDFAR